MWVILFLLEFCECYLELELQLSSNDCLVDLLCEGVDCVLWVGELYDFSLVGWYLVDLLQVICVSVVYLECYGYLWQFVEFGGYFVVNYQLFFSGCIFDFEFSVDGCLCMLLMCSWVSVNNVDVYVVVCWVGFGLIQVLYYYVVVGLVDGSF